ncbi:MAG: thiamine-phosphate kinase [Elusimicrobiota bacterium]
MRRQTVIPGEASGFHTLWEVAYLNTSRRVFEGAPLKNLKQLGEFNLVELIKRRITGGKKPQLPVITGPGDDTFIAETGGRIIAGTCDVLVENVHFSRKWATPEQIGYKCIMVNLSDLAAMGWCEPKYALIGLALTKNTPVRFVEGLYRGMQKASKKYGLIIGGGDTVSSEHDIMISVSLIGEMRVRRPITRSGARPGDFIVVSGTFGDSAVGLKILKDNLKKNTRAAKYLLKKHFLPEPKLELGKILARTGVVTSMIDSSDGLAASIRFITQASRAGAVVNVDNIPVSMAAREIEKDGLALVHAVLHGGEEYELVFTVKPRQAGKLVKRIPGLKIIGRITKNKSVKYYLNGRKIDVKKAGYEHFK